MLDIRFIRENADIVKAGAAKKHIEVDIDRLISVDNERKQLRQELDAKKAEQNRRSNEIQRAQGDERIDCAWNRAVVVVKHSGQIDQDVDAILDKISAGGYQSLSDDEKRILFEASKKLH